MNDLQEAIRVGQAAVDAIPEDHSDRATYLNNLGARLGDRYSRTGSLNDLQEAIRVGKAAVNATPEDHSNRARHLGNLGATLSDRYSRTESVNDLHEALHYLIQCLRQSNSPPLDRLSRWKSLTKLNAETQDWREGAIYFAEYLDLLPKIFPRFNSSYDFQHVLRDLAGLGALTASVFLKAGKSASESLQALEKCRGVISSLMIDARSDVSLLKNGRPDLWFRYSHLREVVAASTFSSSRTSSVSELPSTRNYTSMTS